MNTRAFSLTLQQSAVSARLAGVRRRAEAPQLPKLALLIIADDKVTSHAQRGDVRDQSRPGNIQCFTIRIGDLHAAFVAGIEEFDLLGSENQSKVRLLQGCRRCHCSMIPNILQSGAHTLLFLREQLLRHAAACQKPITTRRSASDKMACLVGSTEQTECEHSALDRRRLEVPLAPGTGGARHPH